MVKTVLHSGPDDHHLPVVVYLDNIAMYGDTHEKLLGDMLAAIKRLATASFTLNLCKNQLV